MIQVFWDQKVIPTFLSFQSFSHRDDGKHFQLLFVIIYMDFFSTSISHPLPNYLLYQPYTLHHRKTYAWTIQGNELECCLEIIKANHKLSFEFMGKSLQ